MGAVEIPDSVAASVRWVGEQALGEALLAAERWRWPTVWLYAREAARRRALRPAPALQSVVAAARRAGRPGARGRRRSRRG